MAKGVSEPSLALSQDQLRVVIGAISDCIAFILAPSGQILLHNPELQARIAPFAHPTDWLAGQIFHDPIERTKLKPGDSLRAKLLADDPVKQIVVGYLRADGAEQITEFHCTKIPGADLKFVTGYDAYLRGPHLDREESTTDSVLHDLGNVLGIIQMAGEGLQQSGLPAKEQTKANDILTAAERGHRLLTAFWRAGSAVPHAPAATDIGLAARHAADVFQRVMPPGIDFDVSLHEAVFVDGTSLAEAETAILSMLGAARRFLVVSQPATGRIGLTMALDEAALTISVTAQHLKPSPIDDLPPLGDLKPVVTLAQQVSGRFETPALQDQSMGLALSMPHIARTEVISGLSQHPAKTDLKGYTLCLVDLDDAVQMSLGRALGKLGASIIALSDGDALRAFVDDGTGFDVAIVPARLQNGMTAHTIAKSLVDHPNAGRLIVMTGKAELTDILQLPAFGVVLRKPVPLDVLINAIRLVPPSGRG